MRSNLLRRDDVCTDSKGSQPMRTGNNRVWQLTNRSALLRETPPHETLGAVHGVHRILNRMCARVVAYHRRSACYEAHH